MIPKNIFQSWHTHTLHPTIQKKIDRMKSMNPEYNHQIYMDEDMDKFVNENFAGEIADCYNRLNIIVAKVDFWRYLVLYKYGGVYLDMDSSIEKPLKDLINDADNAIITAEQNPNLYVQWALIFNKDHPILKNVIDIIVNNIKTNKYPNDIHKMTGPTPYTEGINKTHMDIYGSIIDHANLLKYRDTDITYGTDEISYRLFGVDYNKFLCFKYPESRFLYINKKHWRQEEKEKQLLRS